jgi:hypothetical protein
MRAYTLEEVIDSCLKADINPAYKANATRRLIAYAKQRSAETGSKPSRIIAAVRASVTKKKSNKPKSSARNSKNPSELDLNKIHKALMRHLNVDLKTAQSVLNLDGKI